jgi:hypothetical protein
LCTSASEFFTRPRSPGVVALTWGTNRHLLLSSTTSVVVGCLPRATPPTRMTLPRTPLSGPSTSASDSLLSPHTSRLRLTVVGSRRGGVPLKRTVPWSTPPAGTVTTS